MITRERLATLLEQFSIPEDAYSLDGGHPSEAFVIDRVPEGWVFYYSERGEENSRRVFADEDTACRYLLAEVLMDVWTPSLR